MQSTGLWAQLREVKEIVTEGREAGKGFDDAMAKYYAAIKRGSGALFIAVCRGKVRVRHSSVCPLPCFCPPAILSSRTLLLALTSAAAGQCAHACTHTRTYAPRVSHLHAPRLALQASEGIDFANEHARGVLLLGIPYPALKDTKVRTGTLPARK